MPVTEAHWVKEGLADHEALIGYGPAIAVTISHMPAGEGAPTETRTVSALIDTGATESCIDKGIAQELALPIVDVCHISGVAGVAEHPVYMAHVLIPGLDCFQYGRFTGVDLVAGGQPHGALLGRTFLRGVIMIYDGLRAQVTLASPKML